MNSLPCRTGVADELIVEWNYKEQTLHTNSKFHFSLERHFVFDSTIGNADAAEVRVPLSDIALPSCYFASLDIRTRPHACYQTLPLDFATQRAASRLNWNRASWST